jgi:hypothetical protein
VVIGLNGVKYVLTPKEYTMKVSFLWPLKINICKSYIIFLIVSIVS